MGVRPFWKRRIFCQCHQAKGVQSSNSAFLATNYFQRVFDSYRNFTTNQETIVDSDKTQLVALDKELAVLTEERMDRTEDRLQGALDRLLADMAQRETEAARRETRMTVTIALLMIGIGGLAVAFLSFLIRLPA